MTLKDTEQYLIHRILLHYNYDEAKSISKMALQFILKLSNLNYSLSYRNEVPAAAFTTIHEFINRLQWGEPIQYITGVAHFMDCDFMVSPDVLIPRRETEELVDLIVQENNHRSPITILDIGTGSGCIAIMLSKYLNDAKVFAIDISDKALDIASRNAMKLKAELTLLQANILETEELKFDTFDVIVSNPPYVMEKEKELMHKNVLNYEPHLALFVPDFNALLFYHKIANLAQKCLNPKGHLYFEINENRAAEVCEILSLNNFINIEIRKDMQGKNRMVKGEISNGKKGEVI